MKLQRILATVCVAIASLAAIPLVQAQGVGNLAVLPHTFQQQTPGGGWTIGGAAGPIGVVRDPNGPKWIKNLEGPQGGPFVAPPGSIHTVQELLQIEGNLPWLDWHEEIITPGWEWAQPIVFLANGAPPNNLQVSLLPGTPNHGGAVHFDFDPLFAGTQIIIRKQLQYVGGTDGTAFFGTVQIAQYPTPEPASAALLALGSLAVLRRRRTR